MRHRNRCNRCTRFIARRQHIGLEIAAMPPTNDALRFHGVHLQNRGTPSSSLFQRTSTWVRWTLTLIYLGRYLYRGVISEKDILACADGQVSFRYRDGKTGKTERSTVSGADFLWLVLQHVLPKGFRRARNFGFLHPNCKRLIALLQLLLKFDPARALAWVKQRAPIICTCCGAVMTIVKTRIRTLFPRPAPVPIDAEGAR